MEHRMKLYDQPFGKIVDGKKTIEVRCYDEKRRTINVGDKIIFSHYDDSSRIICVTVTNVVCFKTFRDLYSSYPLEKFGHVDLSVDEMVASAYSIYSKEQEQLYGVVAIHIEKI